MKIDDSIQLKDSDGQLTKSQLSLNINVPHAEIFDNLAELASNLCGTSIAFISLIDNDRHWFQAGVGWNGLLQALRKLYSAHMHCCLVMLLKSVMLPRMYDFPITLWSRMNRISGSMPVHPFFTNSRS